MRLRHTAVAEAEVAEILSYIATDNPIAADRVSRALDRTFDLIASHPLRWPLVHENTRSKLVVGYQYRVYYTIEADEVVVTNVRSTRRLRPWESR